MRIWVSDIESSLVAESTISEFLDGSSADNGTISLQLDAELVLLVAKVEFELFLKLLTYPFLAQVYLALPPVYAWAKNLQDGSLHMNFQVEYHESFLFTEGGHIVFASCIKQQLLSFFSFW